MTTTTPTTTTTTTTNIGSSSSINIIWTSIVVVVIVLSTAPLVSSGKDVYHFKQRAFPGNEVQVSGTNDFSKTIKGDIAGKGHVAAPGQFPFIASIQIELDSHRRYHLCACVLVATNVALTSAHCVSHITHNSYPHYAAVGFNRLTQHGQALIKIVDVIIHPAFQETEVGLPNDMALLILQEHVQLSDTVQLANLSSDSNETFAADICTFAGWGENHDFLNYGEFLVLGNWECNKFLKVTGATDLLHSNMCVWNWPVSTCYADSGGPLICGGVVVGIASWIVDCSGCFPMTLTRVASFYAWIQEYIDPLIME